MDDFEMDALLPTEPVKEAWAEDVASEGEEEPQDDNPAAPSPTVAAPAPAAVAPPVAPAAPFMASTTLDRDLGVSTMDIYANMRADENAGRSFLPESRYLKYRRVLVDWMCEVGEEFELANSTTHVGIALLDSFLQRTTMPKNRLQLVAICCILIAAKYEEAEQNVPTVHQLNEYASNTYTPDIIHHMEIVVLTRLGWSLSITTSLHFLGYFFAKGVVFTSDSMLGKHLVPKVPRYVKKYMDFFADLCQQEYMFQQYLPSQLASAIVLASRKALKIHPTWTPLLEPVLCYSEHDLTPCFEHIWRYFKANFPAQAGASEDKTSTSPATVSAV